MAGLREHCKQRVEQGEAAQLIDPLLDIIEQMNDRLVRLEHRVAQLQQAQYGSKRERISSGQLQLALLQLPAHDSLGELQADLEQDKPETPVRRKQARTPRHIPQSIPRNTILSEPPEACKWCADCRCEKKYIGSEYAEVLEFKPGQFFVERTDRRKYACPKCQSGVVIGPGPHRALRRAERPVLTRSGWGAIALAITSFVIGRVFGILELYVLGVGVVCSSAPAWGQEPVQPSAFGGPAPGINSVIGAATT